MAYGLQLWAADGSLILDSGNEAGKVARENTLGSYAWLNQLNGANISTYMAGAAIHTALIQTAAIDTLRVAGNAITVAAYTGYGSVEIGGAWTSVAGLALNFNYAPYGVLITFTIRGAKNFIDTGSEIGSGGYVSSLGIRVKRDGNIIFDGQPSEARVTLSGDYWGLTAAVGDTPGAGYHTYYLELFSYSGVHNLNGVLFCQGVMR